MHRDAEPASGAGGEGEGSVVCLGDAFDDCQAEADVEPATYEEQVHFCTPEEWWELIERQTQKHFGISADEFVRKFLAGEFGDIDDNRAPLVTNWLKGVGSIGGRHRA